MIPNWFVAWPVSGLENSLATLQSDAPGGLHFLDPRDVHVTLAFLGRFDPALLKKMSALLRGLPLAEIEITSGALVALPQPRRFSAVAYDVRGGLATVEAQIAKWRERICREAGAPVDTRAARPHFTIARPDRRIGPDDRTATLEWIEQINATAPGAHPFRLERPRLYSWADRGADTRYRMLDGPDSSS